MNYLLPTSFLKIYYLLIEGTS